MVEGQGVGGWRGDLMVQVGGVGGRVGGWEGLRKDTHNTGCAYSGWSSHWVTKLLPCEPITGQWLEARL